MADTYTLISSITVGAGGASSIDFTSIPNTYTDLLVKLSSRSTTAANYFDVKISLNGTSTSTNWSRRQLEGGDGSATSATGTNSTLGNPPAASMTANTFGNLEVYIPNYAGSNNKSLSSDSVGEGNSANSVYMDLEALLWSNTAAISQITLNPSAGNFAQYSTAYLYGIKNS